MICYIRTIGLLVFGGILFAADPPPLVRDNLPAKWDLGSRPVGLNTLPPLPEDNPLTPEKVQLGRRLFFDPILSEDNTVACASCHVPQRGYTSPNPTSIGIHGERGRRNAPSLLNVRFGRSFFWDGRARSLEHQALMPISNPREMGTDENDILERLRKDKAYGQQFRKVFESKITKRNVAQALASFQRSLLSGDSPVDRFRAGSASALTREQKLGLWLFESRAGCWRCHSGNNLTDERYHNTGVSWGKLPLDLGRFEVTQDDADLGAFKTPTLRNVALTPPYMHDGSIPTLEAVVEFYSKGGNANPHLDATVRPLKLSKAEKGHLVAFLEALTGEFVGKAER